MDVFETLAGILKPDDNSFYAKTQEFKKAKKPENCNANYHNYGVRKYGFCANCNGTDLKLKKMKLEDREKKAISFIKTVIRNTKENEYIYVGNSGGKDSALVYNSKR